MGFDRHSAKMRTDQKTVGFVVSIQNPLPDLPGNLGRAFVGYWAGFIATLALYVGLYHVLFDVVLNGNERGPLPPVLGLVLSIAAIFIGRHTAMTLDKLDLSTLFGGFDFNIRQRQDATPSVIRSADHWPAW